MSRGGRSDEKPPSVGAIWWSGAGPASDKRRLPQPRGRQRGPPENQPWAPAVGKGPPRPGCGGEPASPKVEVARQDLRREGSALAPRAARRRTARTEPASRPARRGPSTRVPERGPDAGRVGALDLSQDPLVLRRCLQALRLRHLTPIHKLEAPAARPLLRPCSPFSPSHTAGSEPRQPGHPQDDPSLSLGTPSVSSRLPTLCAMPAGACSCPGTDGPGPADLFIESVRTC